MKSKEVVMILKPLFMKKKLYYTSTEIIEPKPTSIKKSLCWSKSRNQSPQPSPKKISQILPTNTNKATNKKFLHVLIAKAFTQFIVATRIT